MHWLPQREVSAATPATDQGLSRDPNTVPIAISVRDRDNVRVRTVACQDTGTFLSKKNADTAISPVSCAPVQWYAHL